MDEAVLNPVGLEDERDGEWPPSNVCRRGPGFHRKTSNSLIRPKAYPKSWNLRKLGWHRLEIKCLSKL